MDAKKVTNNTILMFGLLFGILMSIINFYILPPTVDPTSKGKQVLGLISLILFITLPILAVKYYKDKGYEVTFGEAVKMAVLLGLIGGIIAGIFAVVYFSFLHPENLDIALEMEENVLKSFNKFSPEEIENQMEINSKYFYLGRVFGSVFSGLLYGVIGGLLGGLFFKTPNEDY